MQPTMFYDPAVALPDGSDSLDVTRAKVGFIAGDRPQFADETAAFLRSRLSAAALVMAIVLAAAFLGNLLSGTHTLWWLRGLILVIISGSALLLRSRRTLSLTQLRALEILVFGSVVIQLSLMLLTRLGAYAAQNEVASLVSTRQQFLMGWCILIFVYGTLMPNTWRRAAAIMVPLAVLPYLLLAFQGWRSPATSALLAADHANSVLPFPFVAALIATFASHVINSTRREAFRARQFGQYRLLERLGGGGMGEVFKAEHVLLKRPCAIKLIKPASEADANAIARFETEVKATAKLTHWNTIEIYDYGRTEDGTFYYVMELLPGMSFEDLVEQHGPLPPERVVYLLRQVCGALQEAHAVGLIHRDIKPANMFAAQRGGEYDVAKLLDFGLVKEGSGKQERGATKYGSFSGTPLYMSPEQAAAYEEVDGRADLYSLGAVAYYLLTGHTPFTSKNVVELLAAHRNSEVAPPSRLKPAIPMDLDQIILKCMAKNPAARFSDPASLKAALDACSVAQGWGPEQAARWWQTHPLQTVEPTKEEPRVDATVDYQGGDS